MNYGNFMPEVSPQKIQILLIYPSPGKLQKKDEDIRQNSSS